MAKIIENVAEFEQAIADKAVVDFYADWCGPCRVFGPTIDELATQYEGKIQVVKVNVDTLRALAREYKIHSIPTTVFFKAGKEVARHSGLDDKETMAKLVEENLNK